MTSPDQVSAPRARGVLDDFLGKELDRFRFPEQAKGPTEELKQLVARMCVVAAVDHVASQRVAEAEAHNKVCERHTPQRQKLLGIASKDIDGERYATREEVARICQPLVSEYWRTAVEQLIKDGLLDSGTPRFEGRLRVVEGRRNDIASLRELCEAMVAHIGWKPKVGDFLIDRDDEPGSGMCGIYSNRY